MQLHTDYNVGSVNLVSDVDVSEMTTEHVCVPSMCLINPLQSCYDDGKSMYKQMIQIAGQHLSQSCSQCTVV